jgi:hypothetical protein
VQGYYRAERKKGERISEFDKTLRVDMSVTLTTLDSSIYPKLKKKYDGQRNIIGCEKVHIRVVYEQIIAVVPKRTFDALEEEYRQFIMDYKVRFPLMGIEEIFIRSRNKQKMMIKARSSNR